MVYRARYIEPVEPSKRNDMMKAYHELLNSPDETTRLRAAKAWTRWESVLLPCCSVWTSVLTEYYLVQDGYFSTLC